MKVFNEMMRRFKAVTVRPEILHEDYLHPLTVAELIEIASHLPDKTQVIRIAEIDEEPVEVFVVEFQKNPPRLFLL